MKTLSKTKRLTTPGIFGCSVAGAALGYSEWETAQDLADRMRADIEAGAVAFDDDVGAAAHMGNELERGVLNITERHLGVQLFGNDVSLIHPAHPWLVATPDAWGLREDGAVVLVQAKTANMLGHANLRDLRRKWPDPDDGGEPPIGYFVQVMLEAAIVSDWIDAGGEPGVIEDDPDVLYLAALVGGIGFRLYEIERNRKLERAILDRVVTWYQRHVIDGEPCPPQSAAERLRMAPAKADDDLIESNDDLEKKARKFQKVTRLKKRLEAMEAELKADFAEAIAGHAGVKTEAGKISWSGGKPVERVSKTKLLELAAARFDPEEWAKLEKLATYTGETPKTLRRPNGWTKGI